MKNLMKIATSVLLTMSPLAYADCDCNNLIINGSFEESPLLPSIWETIPGGDNNSITGWTTVGAGVEWYKSTEDTARHPDGNYAVDLNNYYSTNGGGIQQSFTTTIGEQYLIKFHAATFKNWERLGTAKLEVSIGDENYIFNLKNEESLADWTYFSFSFKATSTLSTLKFSTDTNSLKSFTNIDDVSVNHLCGPKAVLIEL